MWACTLFKKPFLLITLLLNTPPQAGRWKMSNTPSLNTKKSCCAVVNPHVKIFANCNKEEEEET